MTKIFRWVIVTLLSCLAPRMIAPNQACAQTAQFLDAKVVNSNLELQWNPITKTLQWDADGSGTFRNFQTDTLFLTNDSIYVTYPLLNPLKVQATASSVSVDDPSYGVITKLIDGFTSLATTVSPAASSAQAAQAQKVAAQENARALNLAPPQPPAPCSADSGEIGSLEIALTPDSATPISVKNDISAWSQAIDAVFADKSKAGPEAIQGGLAALKVNITEFGRAATTAQAAWAAVKSCATAATDPVIKDIFQAAALSDVSTRIQRLTNLQITAQKLYDSLSKDYADPRRWNRREPRDFIISSEVFPTYAKMQTVTAKVATITISTDDNTGLISTEQAVASSVNFSVRKFSVLTPEIGVGAVFGFIERPIYGTGTNATGQTVVAKKSTNNTNVAPTVLANFVCRCRTGLISPMFQLGVAASKDLPALMAGGGIRLFGLGKGDIALGGGAIFGWYKDLQKLKVGSVITGTTDIDNDLAYISTPKTSGYLAIQYKF